MLKDYIQTKFGLIKPGTKIKILYLNDDYVDESSYKDKVFTVSHIDDINQIHLNELGVAVIPEIDQFKIIKESEGN